MVNQTSGRSAKTFGELFGKAEGMKDFIKAARLSLMVNDLLMSIDPRLITTTTETFWVNLAMRNPLDTEVNLSNLTITVQESNSPNAESAKAFVDVEIISNVVLGARETRTVRLV